MRKPRDFDAELQALTDKAKRLKTKKQSQLGELIVATGADALDIEVLAGALLDAAATTDAGRKGAWRKLGASFFRGNTRASKDAGDRSGRTEADGAGPQSPSGEAGAT